MTDIYSKGTLTIAWLGESIEQEHDAASRSPVLSSLFAAVDTQDSCRLEPEYILHTLSCLQQMSCRSQPSSYGRGYHCICGIGNVHRSKRFGVSDQFKVLETDPVIVSRTQENCRVFGEFFCRRYWSRRWVVQELHSSKRLRFCWGLCSWNLRYSETLDGFAMMLFPGCEHVITRLLHYYPQNPAKLSDAQKELLSSCITLSKRGREVLALVGFIAGHGAHHQLEGESILLRLLDQYSLMECSDPRDRLYALTSMARRLKSISPYSPDIIPDYSLTIEEVCLYFARRLADAGFALALFRNASMAFEEQKHDVEPLPSWVPDLRKTFYGHDSYIYIRSLHVLGVNGRTSTSPLHFFGTVMSCTWTSGSVELKLTRKTTVDIHSCQQRSPARREAPCRQQKSPISEIWHSFRRNRVVRMDSRVFTFSQRPRLHQDTIKPGDLLCTDQPDVSIFHSRRHLVNGEFKDRSSVRRPLLIVLRKVDVEAGLYRTVTVLPASLRGPHIITLWMGLDSGKMKRKFGKSEEIVVDIV